MRIKDIKTARTIKANQDILPLGLKKEDVLSATKEYPNNTLFVFKEEIYGEGLSSTRDIMISKGIIEDNADAFTLIDRFVNTNRDKFSMLSTEDLIEILDEVSSEIEIRLTENEEIQKESEGCCCDPKYRGEACKGNDDCDCGLHETGDAESNDMYTGYIERRQLRNEKETKTKRGKNSSKRF